MTTMGVHIDEQNLNNINGLPSGLNAGVERLREYQEKLMRELGPVLWNALNDSNIGEVHCNGNGYVLFKRHGRPGHELHPKRLSPDERERICKAILSIHNVPRDKEKPLYNVEMPFWGCRMAIEGPPTAIGGWEFVFRKETLVRRSLDDLVEQGVITAEEAAELKRAIENKETIVFAGATGAGKTVALQAANDYLVETITENYLERLIYVEHVAELKVEYPNASRWRTDYGTTTMDLMEQALRNTPDRIIAGELKGGEALDYLVGVATGHSGMCTVHANSARHALARLCDLIHMNPRVNANMRAEPLVAEAVDLVMFIQRRPDGTRYCPSFIRVTGTTPEPGGFSTVPAVKVNRAA